MVLLLVICNQLSIVVFKWLLLHFLDNDLTILKVGQIANNLLAILDFNLLTVDKPVAIQVAFLDKLLPTLVAFILLLAMDNFVTAEVTFLRESFTTLVTFETFLLLVYELVTDQVTLVGKFLATFFTL